MRLLEASTSLQSENSADRWTALERVLARVDERYRIWAVRVLEDQVIPRDLGTENVPQEIR